MKLVLDSNVYIRAFREPAENDRLREFERTYAPTMHLSTVVAFELLTGARSTDRRERVDGLIQTFERRRRVVTPAHGTWKRAGRALRRLAEANIVDAGSLTRGFTYDVLIAVSCQEAGATLVTENVRDFTRIQEVLGFEFRAWKVV